MVIHHDQVPVLDMLHELVLGDVEVLGSRGAGIVQEILHPQVR